MSRVTILVEDAKGFEIGLVSVTSDTHHRMIRGQAVSLPLSQVWTPGGVEFAIASMGTGRDPRGKAQTLYLKAETDVFGGAKKRWRYLTNPFGAALIERMEEHEDAELFRLWIREAAARPSMVVRFLTQCTSPDDYRNALLAMRRHIHAGGANVAGAA